MVGSSLEHWLNVTRDAWTLGRIFCYLILSLSVWLATVKLRLCKIEHSDRAVRFPMAANLRDLKLGLARSFARGP